MDGAGFSTACSVFLLCYWRFLRNRNARKEEPKNSLRNEKRRYSRMRSEKRMSKYTEYSEYPMLFCNNLFCRNSVIVKRELLLHGNARKAVGQYPAALFLFVAGEYRMGYGAVRDELDGAAVIAELLFVDTVRVVAMHMPVYAYDVLHDRRNGSQIV